MDRYKGNDLGNNENNLLKKIMRLRMDEGSGNLLISYSYFTTQLIIKKLIHLLL